MKKIAVLASTALAALAVMLPGGCASQTSEPDTATKERSLTLSVSPHSTRGPEEPLPNEKINRYTVIFTDNTGAITHIVHKDLDSPVMYDPIPVEDLLSIHIHAYAFANMDDAAIADALGLETLPAVGDVLTYTGVAALKYSVPQETLDDPEAEVPMTGYLEIPAGETDAWIEAVRLCAKLRFDYTNTSSSVIKILSASITPATTGSVPLLPDYEALAVHRAPVPQDPAAVGTRTITYRDLTLPPAATAVEGSHIYLLEGVAPASGRFTLGFVLQREGSEPESVSVLADFDASAVPGANHLTHFNRNDFIIIPVETGDVTVTASVNFYPPIGGYPAVVNSLDRDLSVCFGSAGDFEIAVTVNRNGTPLHTGYRVRVMSVTGDPIFATTPALDPVTGEITGTVGSTHGTADVALSITVEPETAGALPVTYTRHLYLTRQ